MKLLLAGVGLVGLLAIPWRSESPSVAAAKSFLATLTPEQRRATQVPFDNVQRKQWAYVPLNRKGISWAEMNTTQRSAAEHLLSSALSKEGRLKVESIRELELVLREIENNNMSRDPEKYWFAVYGDPSSETQWAWRYEGHHTSLTFGYRTGAEISSTPQFLGTNPAEVRTGAKKGTRVLAKEQDLAYAFLASLTSEQRKQAILASQAPADILTTNSTDARSRTNEGLTLAGLSKESRRQFESLMSAHAELQTKSEQQRRLKKAQKDPNIHFAWLGSTKPGEKHYYRIQGDTFLIEFDNTQNDANHIHTVWREFDEDFGGDPLAEHYAHYHNASAR